MSTMWKIDAACRLQQDPGIREVGNKDEGTVVVFLA
jgi:hypothetical protein